MPQVHLEQCKRFCNAKTNVTGQNSVYCNNKLVAVEGDKDDHQQRGDLIQRYGDGSIMINNKKMIVAPGDTASPDSQGNQQHPLAPTDPQEGSQNTFAYNGKCGGGNCNMSGGNLNIGELVKMGGQLIGMVKNFTNNGNGTGSLSLQNMGSQTPSAGDTLTGDDSGNSVTLTSFTRDETFEDANTSPDYNILLAYAVTDDYGVVAMPEYFTGLPSQDYQTGIVVADDS